MARNILKHSRPPVFSNIRCAVPIATASIRDVHFLPITCPTAATIFHARPISSSLIAQTAFPHKARESKSERHKQQQQQEATETEQRQEQGHQKERLTHTDTTGAAHMVDIAHKQVTSRAARATCTIYFSDATAPRLIRENSIKKGDVLGTARLAGIMAAKRTPDWIPLCHPIMLSHVSVELAPVFTFHREDVHSSTTSSGSGSTNDGHGNSNKIDITARVRCDGKTGVEMEALTAASAAALTVYDMCKAVDKGMRIEGLRLLSKTGGKSGPWGEAHEEEGT